MTAEHSSEEGGEGRALRSKLDRLHAQVARTTAERDDLRGRLAACEAAIDCPHGPRHYYAADATCQRCEMPSWVEALFRAALANPSADKWPACATYPNLGCVCRGSQQSNTATCTRKRTGDLTPIPHLANPSAAQGEADPDSHEWLGTAR